MLTTGIVLAATLSTAVQSPATVPRNTLPVHIHMALTHSGSGLFGPVDVAQNIDITVRNGVARRGSTMVPIRLVRQLLLSLRGSRVESPTPRGLGMTQAWLKAEAPKVLTQYESSYRRASMFSERQKSVFIRHFCDARNVVTWIDAHYGLSGIRTITTDDYPHVRVHIRWDNRRSITIDSTAQTQFMLPWRIEPTNQQTYNVAISKAIAALVPRGAPNSDRLTGIHLAETYASYILDRYSSELARVHSRQ